MNKTSIEWTDFTWNPIRARLKGQGPKVHSGTFCTRISPGCTNCYASVINKRFGNGLEYTVPNLERVEFFIDEKILEEPLRRKKPARIFVGDMFDLFHEAIPDEQLDLVFDVMYEAQDHTFQLLTKRADRMHEAVERLARPYIACKWPLPNVWLGVSVEDQQRADERIPLLLQTLAAVRFLSVEPQLESVDLWSARYPLPSGGLGSAFDWGKGISWVICGGESGPGARPFHLGWAKSLLEQCRAAGVPFFMKQAGTVPVLEESTWSTKYSPMRGLAAEKRYWLKASHDGRTPDGCVPLLMRDRKGGDPFEWPESLRVREFPASQKAEVVSA